jgi:hypothetical protein
MLSEKFRLHNAALAYAAKGYRVVPCIPNTKIPAIKDNLNQATTASAQIDQWWNWWPEANIAVIPPKGISIIDIDVKSGDGLAEWKALGGKIDTYTVITPSGGLHLYYAGDMPSSNGKIGRFIDVRGSDGRFFIMVPPSIVNGKEYIAEHLK